MRQLIPLFNDPRVIVGVGDRDAIKNGFQVRLIRTVGEHGNLALNVSYLDLLAWLIHKL